MEKASTIYAPYEPYLVEENTQRRIKKINISSIRSFMA